MERWWGLGEVSPIAEALSQRRHRCAWSSSSHSGSGAVNCTISTERVLRLRSLLGGREVFGGLGHRYATLGADFWEGGKVFLVMAEPASDAQPMAVNDEQGGGAAALDFVPPPKPQFGALSAHEMNGGKFEFRKVFVPQHRFTPLKEHWMEIYTPVFEQMKIDIRMNLKVWPCFRVWMWT
jgi:hypothetical protein